MTSSSAATLLSRGIAIPMLCLVPVHQSAAQAAFDVSVSLSAHPSDDLSPGTLITLSLVVRNEGDIPAEIVIVRSSPLLPGEVDISQAMTDCVVWSTAIADTPAGHFYLWTWSIGIESSPPLQVGEQRTCHVTMTLAPTAPPLVELSFGLTFADSNPANNVATVGLYRAAYQSVAVPSSSVSSQIALAALIGMFAGVAVRWRRRVWRAPRASVSMASRTANLTLPTILWSTSEDRPHRKSAMGGMKILFTPYSGGAIAHITRLLAVADELRARGHEIRFTTSAAKKAFVESAGYAVHGAGHAEVNLNDEHDQGVSYFANHRDLFLSWLGDEIDAARAFAPDVIVSSPNFLGSTASLKLGIPQVSVINAQWLPEYRGLLGLSLAGDGIGHRVTRAFARPLFERKFSARYLPEVRGFYQQLGIDELPYSRADLHRRTAVLVPGIPDFEPVLTQ